MNKNWLYTLLALLVFTVLSIEFFIDLSKGSKWQDAILVIDSILIIGYLLCLVSRSYKSGEKFLFWLWNNKIEFFVFIAAFAVLVVPRLSAAIIVGRIIIGTIIYLLNTDAGKYLLTFVNLRPTQTLALSFLSLILFCTVLLTFPAATKDGYGASFIDALFTMTSAVCITGLSIHDIGNYFSLFGQLIILLGIQTGAIGIMVISAIFAVLIGNRLVLRYQAGLYEILDIKTAEGLKNLIKAVIMITFTTEVIGAVCLAVLWREHFSSITQLVWWSVFHSISAYCNAGFSLATNSLTQFATHPLINFVFIMLITLGSIGFLTISDLTNKNNWVKLSLKSVWERLQLQTKIILASTLVLNILGMILFLFFEYDGALGELNIFDKLMASMFQAVTLRSAGFNTVPISEIIAPSIIFCVIWMFIGAAPTSTGGGIKITTFTVVFMAIKTMLRKRFDIEIMGRRLSKILIYRSISIIIIAILIIFIFFILLSATQDIKFEKLLFEIVSAFGTTGLSMGATSELDSLGKILVSILMFIGRLGPLTLALAVGEKVSSGYYRYPKGQVAVG